MVFIGLGLVHGRMGHLGPFGQPHRSGSAEWGSTLQRGLSEGIVSEPKLNQEQSMLDGWLPPRHEQPKIRAFQSFVEPLQSA
jgi:hypothetical protein